MSILEIGKGASETLTYQLEIKDIVLSPEDKLLYAIQDENNNIIYTQEATINELPFEDNIYAFIIKLSSSLTKTFDIGKKNYAYDITLIQGNEKIPLSEVMHFDVVETIGASISEG